MEFYRASERIMQVKNVFKLTCPVKKKTIFFSQQRYTDISSFSLWRP